MSDHHLVRWWRVIPIPNVATHRPVPISDSYLHLVIGSLEYLALIELLGPGEVQRVVAGWSHYTWIYATIRRDVDAIGKIVARHDLLP